MLTAPALGLIQGLEGLSEHMNGYPDPLDPRPRNRGREGEVTGRHEGKRRVTAAG